MARTRYRRPVATKIARFGSGGRRRCAPPLLPGGQRAEHRPRLRQRDHAREAVCRVPRPFAFARVPLPVDHRPSREADLLGGASSPASAVQTGEPSAPGQSGRGQSTCWVWVSITGRRRGQPRRQRHHDDCPRTCARSLGTGPRVRRRCGWMGDGAGKWRLTATPHQHSVRVMSLLESPTGGDLTNLSSGQGTEPGSADWATGLVAPDRMPTTEPNRPVIVTTRSTDGGWMDW